jgi:hypothetical protein
MWAMPRSSRRAALIVALAAAWLPAWAAAEALQAPKSASVGAEVTVHASGLLKGSYALTLVSDSHPARGVSCVARLSRSKAASAGAVTLGGTIPVRLHCYQGLAGSLGAVPTKPGAYRLVVAEPTAPAGFDARASFVSSALGIKR